MVRFLIGSHVFQVIGGFFFQRDTNGVNRDIVLLQLLNLLVSVPIAITLGFASATGCAVRDEDHIAGMVGLLRSRAPIEIIIGLLQRGTIVGTALCRHFINLTRNGTQIIGQVFLNFDSTSIVCSTLIVLVCKADNSQPIASGGSIRIL